MKLLQDETRFVGASLCANKCVITTDSRAVVVDNGDESQWILSGTSQRFALPCQLLETTGAFVGVKSDKLSLVMQTSGGEETVIGRFEAPIFAFFTLTQNTLVVLENGHCELRSTLANAQPLAVYRPVAAADVKPASLVAVEMISPQLVVLVYSNGLVRIVRAQDKSMKQEREFTLPITAASLPLKKATLHELDQCEEEGEFALALLDSKSKLYTFQILANSVVEPWLVGLELSVQEEGLVMTAAPGLRVLRFSAAKKQVQAWDICHGVLLETWSVAQCDFISMAGKDKLVFGNAKQIEYSSIDSSSTSSLARSLGSAVAQEQQPAKKKTKLTKDAVEKRLGNSDKKTPTVCDEFEVESAQQFAYSNGWFDILIKLMQNKQVCSTKLLGDSPLSEALEKHGRVDFCVAAIEHCNDIPAQHVVSFIKSCLLLVGGDDGKRNDLAVKAVRSFANPSNDHDSLDFGVAKLVCMAFLCKAMVEAEFLQALAQQFSSVEETLALVSCLRFGANLAEESKQAVNVLLACAHPLNLVSDKCKLPEYAQQSLDQLRSRIQKEINVCEKSEKCSQRLDMLLGGAMPLKPKQSSAKYQVETLML